MDTNWQETASDLLSGDTARMEKHLPPYIRRTACPRCERADVKLTKVRGDSASYRCRFCGKRFRVAYDGR